MELEKLPDDVRKSIDELLHGVESALAADSETPHIRAVSVSSIAEHQADNPNPTLTGGAIVSPGRPPFDYDEDAIKKLHRAALEAGKRLLHTIIVHAERKEAGGPWRLTTKLVTRPEYTNLRKARESIELQLKSELNATAAGATRVSFGRDKRGAKLRLIRQDESERSEPPPTPQLLELFARIESVYRESGLDPIVAFWTLRGGEVDFREYFE